MRLLARAGGVQNAWADLLQRGDGQLGEYPGFLVANAGFAEARRVRRLESPLAQEHPRIEAISNGLLLNFLIRRHLLPHDAAGCFEVLGAEPSATRAILGMWRHNSRIERVHCIDGLPAQRATLWHFGTLPGIQQVHSLVSEAATEGWGDRISSHGFSLISCLNRTAQTPRSKLCCRTLRRMLAKGCWCKNGLSTRPWEALYESRHGQSEDQRRGGEAIGVTEK